MGGPTAFATDDPNVVIVNLQQHWCDCHICGEPTLAAWGVPVWNGFIVANDWPGDWGGVSVCKSCHDRHAAGEFVEVPTSDYHRIQEPTP
jgi:hypothetical protein